MSKSIRLPKEYAALFRPMSKLSAEREGRYRRLCGTPRDSIEQGKETRKRDILRGYDRSEEDWYELLHELSAAPQRKPGTRRS